MVRKRKMTRLTLILLCICIVGACAFCLACGGVSDGDDEGENPPTVTVSLVGADSGSGTEADPYKLRIEEGATEDISIVAENTTETPEINVTGEAASIVRNDKTLKVTAVKPGSARVTVKFTAAEKELYLDVTVWDNTSAISGTVNRYGDGNRVFAGVTVRLTSSDYTAYSVTDEDGVYWFTHLDSNSDYTVELLFAGDYSDYVSDRAAKTVTSSEFADSERLCKRDFGIIAKSEAPSTDIKGTVTSAGKAVAGIKVSANGEQNAVTDEHGDYTLKNVFAFGDITVTAEGENDTYALYRQTLSGEDIVPSGITETDMELGLPYADYGIVCYNDTCGGYYFKYTRSGTGLEFSFAPQGGTLLGNIELFIDTLSSSYNRDSTDYMISTDGKFAIVSSFGVSPVASDKVSARKETDELGNETVYITVPYEFFAAQGKGKEVKPSDVIGISLGYKVKPVWVGWEDTLSGGGRLYDNSLYIAPEHPVAYMRLDKDNNNYRCDANAEADFTGYKGSFGFGHNRADAVYVNVVKTAEGIKMDFMTTGNFGGKGEKDEFVLLYLDLDGVKQGAWGFGEGDLTVRLYGDGTVRYKGGSPWWHRNAQGVQVIEKAFTVSHVNHVTTFGYTLPWSVIGITADEQFGFALREACDSSVDMTLYGTPGEFVYDGHRVGDTAMQTDFVHSSVLGGSI